MRFTAVLLIGLVLPGCFLFRKSLREQLPDLPMIRVEGGSFQVGDFYENENLDAIPCHPATVETFWLAKYEVTYDQYDAFALATGRPLPEDDDGGRGQRAVANVTWDEAAAFCAAYGYRLPSEIEWEYAARSGGREQAWAGTDTDADLDEYALYAEAGVGRSEVVGLRLPNALGLHDMSGNVAEWIGDYYQFYPQPGEEPVYNDTTVSDIRLVRGGSFNQSAEILRTYWRAGTLRDVRSFTIGFRCAASRAPD